MDNGQFKMVPASYLVLIKDGKVLLLKRQNTTHWDGYFSVPAGHVMENEGYTKAVIREAKEEVNLDLNPEDLKAIHFMNRFEKSNSVDIRERADVFFTASNWKGEITNNEPEKCAELLWADLNNLPENTIPYIKNCLNKIKDNIFYSEWDY